jgi:outer membrane protein
MRRLHITLIGLLFAASAASGQEVLHMSLAECTDYALKHHYSVKNAKIDVLIQDVQNKETLSASYPHVNGNVQATYFNIPQSSFIDVSTFPSSDTSVHIAPGTVRPVQFTVPYSATAGFTASQLIFDGSVFVAWKARNTVMEFARRNEKVTEESIRYNVYKSYNSIVIAYRQFDILKRSLAFARSLEHDLEVTRQNGFAEKIDVERTSVQVNNLATDSMRIANMVSVSEQLLKYQMGMDLMTTVILTDTNVEQKGQSVASLLAEEKNYERVPEYEVLSAALKLNEYNLQRYKLAALPTLSAFWGYGVNNGSASFNQLFYIDKYYHNSYSSIGLQLNVPIYNGGLRANQVREARLNIEKSENNIANMKQTIDFQVATGRSNLRNAVLQTQSQKRNMELADDVLDLAQKKYKAGVGSNLEVTQAQTDQLRAETGYFSALLDVINAEADLKKALGLLK